MIEEDIGAEEFVNRRRGVRSKGDRSTLGDSNSSTKLHIQKM